MLQDKINRFFNVSIICCKKLFFILFEAKENEIMKIRHSKIKKMTLISLISILPLVLSLIPGGNTNNSDLSHQINEININDIKLK